MALSREARVCALETGTREAEQAGSMASDGLHACILPLRCMCTTTFIAYDQAQGSLTYGEAPGRESRGSLMMISGCDEGMCHMNVSDM